MKTHDRRVWLALGLMLIMAFVLRIVFAALPRVVRWDEAAYQMIAQSLLVGRGYYELVGAPDIQQPPMVAYLSLLGFSLRLPLQWATAGIAYILLGGLLVLPVYGLGRGIYGRRVGLIAGLLAVAYPALAVSPLYWSTMTEPVYVLCLLCGIYATWRATQMRTGGWKWAAAMGLAFGLAYLTRPEAVAYLAVMLVYLLAWRGWGGRWTMDDGRWTTDGGRYRQPSTVNRQHRTCRWVQVSSIVNRRWSVLLLAGLAVAVFVLCAAPYVIYLRQITGRWMFSGKQGVSVPIAWAYVNHNQAEHDRAVASLDASGKEIMWLSASRFDDGLVEWIIENPRRFLWQVRKNVDEMRLALFHEDLLSPGAVVLMGLGLFARPWTRRRLRGELLLILALVPLASLWVFFVLSRFLAVVIPIGLLWMAAGIDHLAGWGETTLRNLSKGGSCPEQEGRFDQLSVRAGRNRGCCTEFVRALPLAAALAAFLWIGIGVAGAEIPRQPFWRVEAARWLSEHVPPGSPVMVRSTEVALYADLPMVAFPNAEWAQVLAYGRSRDARYLVVDEAEIRDIRPHLAALVELDTAQPLPGVTLLARLSGSGRTTYIYEFGASP